MLFLRITKQIIQRHLILNNKKEFHYIIGNLKKKLADKKEREKIVLVIIGVHSFGLVGYIIYKAGFRENDHIKIPINKLLPILTIFSKDHDRQIFINMCTKYRESQDMKSQDPKFSIELINKSHKIKVSDKQFFSTVFDQHVPWYVPLNEYTMNGFADNPCYFHDIIFDMIYRIYKLWSPEDISEGVDLALKFIEELKCNSDSNSLRWKYYVLMSDMSTYHGNFHDAVEHMLQAIKLLPESSDFSQNEIFYILESKLCSKYIMCGDFGEGMKLATELLKKKNEISSPLLIAYCFYNLGYLLKAAGNVDEANSCFSIVLKLSEKLDKIFLEELQSDPIYLNYSTK